MQWRDGLSARLDEQPESGAAPQHQRPFVGNLRELLTQADTARSGPYLASCALARASGRAETQRCHGFRHASFSFPFQQNGDGTIDAAERERLLKSLKSNLIVAHGTVGPEDPETAQVPSKPTNRKTPFTRRQAPFL